jgi:hypothetical protein
MAGASLTISLDVAHVARPVARPPDADYTAYPGLLRAAGFSTIVVEGLGRLGARGADGAPIDRVELSVEEDAEQLALACDELAHLEIRARPRRHEIYLQGGEFEITALLAEGQAIVRAGVFDRDIDPGDDRNVRMTPAEYFALWSAIGEALDAAAAGLRRPQGSAGAARAPERAPERTPERTPEPSGGERDETARGETPGGEGWRDELDSEARRALQALAAGGDDLSGALAALLQVALRIADDPGSSREASEAVRQRLAGLLGDAGRGLDTLEAISAALPGILREQASRAGAEAEFRPAIDAASQIVALLERLDAMPASPHRDALAALLPEPSVRGPETDAERSERLYREAKERILASMRKHGIEGS